MMKAKNTVHIITHKRKTDALFYLLCLCVMVNLYKNSSPLIKTMQKPSYNVPTRYFSLTTLKIKNKETI